MRFALIGPVSPFRGGIAQYTNSLSRALENEHRVLVISFQRQYPEFFFPGRTQIDTSRDAGQADAEFELDSINPLSWRRVSNRLIEYRPDATIFQWWHPFFAPAYLMILKRLRKSNQGRRLFLCHNVHPHERLKFPGGKRIENQLIRSAFQQVEGFLVHSAQMTSEIHRYNQTAPIQEIYHPCYDFYSQWDRRRPRRPGRPRMLFFGNIRPYKGLDVFLQALSRLVGKMDFEAVVAGEFYMDPKPFRQFAEASGLTTCLKWIDHYIPNEAVPDLFRETDLVVLPYENATQSGVIPLAYLFNVPVIATDVGGLSEVVMEGSTGYLIPPGDPVVLARKIMEFFSEKKSESFIRAIEIFKKRFSWQQVVEKLLRLVEDIDKLAETTGTAATQR